MEAKSGYVLGVNFSHDRSACLLRDGQIVTAVAEERLDRIKRSEGCLYTRGNKGGRTIPNFAIGYCLDAAGIGIDDLDLLVIDHALTPVDLDFLRRMIPMKEKQRIRSLPHPSHHLAHAATVYHTSGYEDAAVLVADAFGSSGRAGVECESGFLARGPEIELLFKNYQTGQRAQFLCLTGMYRLVTQVLGFVVPDRGEQRVMALDDAGKTMGLAAHGEPRDRWPSFVRFPNRGKTDGSAPMMDFSGVLDLLESENLISFNRDPRSKRMILDIVIRGHDQPLTDLHRDLAATVQEEFTVAMIEIARELHRLTGLPRLCLSGGAALNSVANSRIIDETPFEEIFIFPAGTDDGNALGCAYYGWYNLLGHSWMPTPLVTPFLGIEYDEGACRQAAAGLGLLPRKAGSDEELVEWAAGALDAGKVVGWFQGGSEFGPRALGHRSLLADPRRPASVETLNREIKFREAFRPYAPSVIEERQTEYFELDRPSPYMLQVAPVHPGKREEIPAVTHVDGTARVQTVSRSGDPLYHRLIQRFGELSGVPLLLNTSMNRAGEPMVESPVDALRLFKGTRLDALALGRFIFEKLKSRAE
jgi:carbamoyltransferase